MKLYLPIFITLAALLIDVQASAGMEYKPLVEKQAASLPLSDLDDIYKPLPGVETSRIIFQRSDKLLYIQNGCRNHHSMLVFGNSFGSFHFPDPFKEYSVPLSIKLIFPKHYFF